MGEERIKILLVDDNQDDYVMTRDMLSEAQAESFELEWAKNYDSALQHIHDNHYDVCLFNHRLGEYTGLELMRQAMEDGCKAPMILLAGEGDREKDIAALKAGASDYLVKSQIKAPLLEHSIRYAIERKRIEEELHKSQVELSQEHQRLNELFGDLVTEREEWQRTLNCIEDMIIRADDTGNIKRCNNAVTAFTGKSYNEISGQSWDELLFENDSDMEVGRTYGGNIELFHRSKKRWFLLKSHPFIEENGVHSGFVIIVQDYSTLKNVKHKLEDKNEELKENKGKLQAALDEISALILRVVKEEHLGVRFNNPNLKKCYDVLNCNQKNCNCYGIAARRCWQDTGTYCLKKINKDFANKYTNCTHCPVYRYATSDPIYQIGEHFNNMMHIIESKTNDLEKAYTELKHAEGTLKKYNDKLEQSNRDLEDFAYIASHDLQEPLRKVTAFGDRLNTKCGEALGDQGRDYLERMQNAAKRMQELINGLLEFSRVTTKAKPFKPVNLSQVIKDVLSDLEVRIEQTEGKVETGPLPTIEGDPLQMRQLFQNLIGNALKFSQQDKPPIVKIHSKQVQGNGAGPNIELCEITVEDNGIGFDEKYADRIFGVFQRLHGRNEYQGTGIGLSVCKKIVERHHGAITAKCRPGEGATFIITLPLHQPQAEKNQEE